MHYHAFTLSFRFTPSGNTVPLTLAMVSSIFNASSSRPLASSHLGDSGRNLCNNNTRVGRHAHGNGVVLTCPRPPFSAVVRTARNATAFSPTSRDHTNRITLRETGTSAALVPSFGFPIFISRILRYTSVIRISYEYVPRDYRGYKSLRSLLATQKLQTI